VEKHFTLRRADGGVDSTFSLEPEEMKALVVETERAWQSLGNVVYGPTEAEKKSLAFRRSIYVAEDRAARAWPCSQALRHAAWASCKPRSEGRNPGELGFCHVLIPASRARNHRGCCHGFVEQIADGSARETSAAKPVLGWTVPIGCGSGSGRCSKVRVAPRPATGLLLASQSVAQR
jgi:hypothetical protein